MDTTDTARLLDPLEQAVNDELHRLLSHLLTQVSAPWTGQAAEAPGRHHGR